jgi:glycerol-3-phosphate cytidylyltransferase
MERKFPGGKMIRGLTCGAFDLLHAGHILFFKECKRQCDHLIIALHIDPSVEREWKHKPVETVEERTIRLEGCRYVDEIVFYNTEQELWELEKRLMPDIVFHGADHEGKPYTGSDLPIRHLFIKRDHNFSSSNLRARIAEAEKGH